MDFLRLIDKDTPWDKVALAGVLVACPKKGPAHPRLYRGTSLIQMKKTPRTLL